MSRPIASPVPGEVLTVWALTASGSFERDADNEQLLDRITVSTSETDDPVSCQAQDNSSWKVSRRVKWKNAAVVLVLWLAYMIGGVALSVMNPFFPQIAEKRGANSVLIGVIISAAPLTVFVISPVLGYLLPHVAVWLQILSGLLLIGCSYLSFAFVVLLPSTWTFVLVSVLLRMVEGVGTAVLFTVIYSTFPALFPKYITTLVGLFEIGGGFGFAVGPSLGGILYEYGGYRMPFLFVGGSLLLFVIPCTLLVMKLNIVHERKSLPAKVICKLSTNVTVIVLIMIIIISAHPSFFFAPSLPTFLDHLFNQSPFQIGLMYVLVAVSYLLGAFFVGPLVDKVGRNRIFSQVGLVIVTVSFLVIGLPYYMDIMNVWFIRFAYATIGFGAATATVVIYPELLKIGTRYMEPGDAANALSSFISGLISAALSLNCVISPLIGGAVTTALTIPEFAVVLAEVMLAQAVLLVGLSVIDKIAS